MGKRISSITPKQKLFCEEWLVHRNATRAYLKAYGGTYDTARVEGPKNLAKPACLAYLKPRIESIQSNIDMSLDMVVSELSKIAKSNILDMVNVDEKGNQSLDIERLTHEHGAVIQELKVTPFFISDKDGEPIQKLKVKIKLYDKRAALVDLGRHLGGFAQKFDHKSSDGSMSPRPIIDASKLSTQTLIELMNATNSSTNPE